MFPNFIKIRGHAYFMLLFLSAKILKNLKIHCKNSIDSQTSQMISFKQQQKIAILGLFRLTWTSEPSSWQSSEIPVLFWHIYEICNSLQLTDRWPDRPTVRDPYISHSVVLLIRWPAISNFFIWWKSNQNSIEVQ